MRLSVAVFCGSRAGFDPQLREAAVTLGAGLAAHDVRLIFGGGRIGLMGALADAVLAGGGQVIGVIPEFLTRLEVAHDGLTELHITDSMHSRKRMMFDLADAFVTIPGGFGTLDETVEIITWRQLGLHDKPVFVCNVNGWANALLSAFGTAIADGFADPKSAHLYEVVTDVRSLLARLQTLAPRGADASSRL